VNIVRGKKLTNMRASGSDDSLRIAPKLKFSLEEAMSRSKMMNILKLLLKSENEKMPAYKFA